MTLSKVATCLTSDGQSHPRHCHAYTRSDMNESPSSEQPTKSDKPAFNSTFVVRGRAMQREGPSTTWMLHPHKWHGRSSIGLTPSKAEGACQNITAALLLSLVQYQALMQTRPLITPQAFSPRFMLSPGWRFFFSHRKRKRLGPFHSARRHT